MTNSNQTQSAAQHDALEFNTEDILEAPWGFGLTGVDFYQVIRVTASGKSAVLRKIAKSYQPDGQLSGTSVPKPDQFIGEAMIRRVTPYDSCSPQVRIDQGAIATRWTGVPFFESRDQ